MKLVHRVATVCTIAAATSAAVIAGASVASVTASTTRASREIGHCVRVALDPGPARTQTHSVSRRTLREFSLLRRPVPAGVRHPATRTLAIALGRAGARSFDPRAIRLLASVGSERVDLVAATIAPPRLPSRCRSIRQLVGLSSFVAQQALTAGAGPGVCVLAQPTAADSTGRSGYCLADERLIGYFGALARLSVGSRWLTLVPDGIRSLTLRFPSGMARIEAVHHNLAPAEPLPTFDVSTSRPSFAALARRFERWLRSISPSAVRFSTTAGRTLGPYRAPRGHFALEGRAFAFLVRLITTATGS